jgi:hypothetical protein
MTINEQKSSPREWAVANFSGAELSDVRRVERAITIAEAMAASPGASLPQMFAHGYDLKAAYQFFRHPEATPDQLQAGHREGVLLEMEKPGVYLLLEDTTEVLCAGEQEIEGLGPVGASKEGQIGFHLHSVLAVRWPTAKKPAPPRRPPVAVLGLADQQYHVRQDSLRGKTTLTPPGWPINSTTCASPVRTPRNPMPRCVGCARPRSWNRRCGNAPPSGWGQRPSAMM